MQKDREKQQLYEEYVKKVTPTHSLPANMVKAFLVGGLICVSGQVFGIGSKIFTIAGPVILYGVLTSWVLGLIQYVAERW